MARPYAREEDRVVETWESVVPGATYLWTYDRRDDRYIKSAVGGRHSRRLHITRDDRKYNQELIPIENKALDPFTNGSLRFLEAATRDENLDTRYHLTQEELTDLFEVRDVELFVEAIKDIGSELILRRLAAIGEDKATVAQLEALKDLIRERYPIGGTQASLREDFATSSRLAATNMR